MTSLVIVESPAKCSKIQGFLGPGWKVIASMGHIRSLEQDLDAVGIERDFEPKFEFLKEKAKAIASLKDAAKSAKTVYLASDDDREGEAIAYSVALLLGLSPETTPRSVFHEITEKAVKKAIAEPRRIDMNRVNAQQARSVLDMMVGFTISPLLWSYVGPALSAGRCQTPALRLVCEREKAILDFSSSTVWRLKGKWASAATKFPFEAILKDELEDEESALNFLENIYSDVGGTILEAQTREWFESPPKPLITSSLQQEASALFSSNPKKTMMIAQKLYEAGHITYMRTDHPVLSEEAVQEASALVQKLFGEAYIQKSSPIKKAKAGTEKANAAAAAAPAPAQEAHEAIRPTHFELQELDASWESLDRRIYKLIWNRAVQSVMAAAKGDERTITFVADGDPGEFPWEAKWRRTNFMGWKKIGTAAARLDESEEAAQEESAQAIWIQAASLKQGDKLKWNTLEAYPVLSKAPPRFNEATLVRELEKKGIGRPSTYASLVATLFEKKYVEKKDKPAQQVQMKQYSIQTLGVWPPVGHVVSKSVGAEKEKLVPTPLGSTSLQFCVQEFPELFAYDFTSQMESRLDKVATGEEFWKHLCRDTWKAYKDHYVELKTKKSSSSAGKGPSAKVREFGEGLKAVLGKKGPILLQEDPSGDAKKTKFYGWPGNTGFQELSESEARAFLATLEAPKLDAWGTFEGQPILKKSGPFGIYFESNGVRVPGNEMDTVDSVVQKLATKKSSALHVLGPFEFRRGPYGVYMFKQSKDGKKPTFVGLPEGLDPCALTLEAAERIYSNGSQQKKESGRGTSTVRGRGGRGRGRGGRGGGRGGQRNSGE